MGSVFFGGWWLKMYCRIAGLGVGGVWGTVLGHGYGRQRVSVHWGL